MKNQPLVTRPSAARPYIVCLCGSTRFAQAFQKANLDETLAGKVVLSVGGFGHADKLFAEYGGVITPKMKIALDLLHLQKIDLADEVYILNVNGYIGESTMRELAYAIYRRKELRFLEQIMGEQFLIRERHKLGEYVADFFLDSKIEIVDAANMKGNG